MSKNEEEPPLKDLKWLQDERFLPQKRDKLFLFYLLLVISCNGILFLTLDVPKKEKYLQSFDSKIWFDLFLVKFQYNFNTQNHIHI